MKKYKRWNGKRKAEVAIALLKVPRELQGRQYLQRGPTIDSAACPVDRPKKIRSLDQVFCRKFEKQRLVRLADERPSTDLVIVEFVTDFGSEREAVVSRSYDLPVSHSHPPSNPALRRPPDMYRHFRVRCHSKPLR